MVRWTPVVSDRVATRKISGPAWIVKITAVPSATHRRRVVIDLAGALVGRGERSQRAAFGRDHREALFALGHHDLPVRPPARAEHDLHIADRDRAAAGERDLLQLALGLEADPGPVGREERLSAPSVPGSSRASR